MLLENLCLKENNNHISGLLFRVVPPPGKWEGLKMKSDFGE